MTTDNFTSAYLPAQCYA